MRNDVLDSPERTSPPLRWGAIAVVMNHETGETKQTCMYCYRPWHDDHYCGEPESDEEAPA